MLKELFTALLCSFAIAGQMRAQEVVVAREAKPNPTERVAPVSEGTDSESETVTKTKSQDREKKSASSTITVEQMRMAGALAAERQKKQTPAEQTSSVGGSSWQGPKAATLAARQKTETRVEQANAHRAPTAQTTNSEALSPGPVRPTMLESGKQEPAASHPAKAGADGGQTNVPQSANRALRKKEPMAFGPNRSYRDSSPTPAQWAPSTLHLTSPEQETRKDSVQAITKESVQVTAKEKTAKGIRSVTHYSYKTPEGKKESVPVITHYYPKRFVYPFAKVDRHIDRKLMQAATIAQERAHAHSRSMCWHYVKEALLASGVIDSRPKSELAKDAARDLVSNYGFKKLSVRDPFAAPVGSVLVYGANRAAGHVEIRTKDGFVSDFCSKTPSPRPLLGVYAKL
jgi:hypothetical protein